MGSICDIPFPASLYNIFAVFRVSIAENFSKYDNNFLQNKLSPKQKETNREDTRILPKVVGNRGMWCKKQKTIHKVPFG